MNVVYSGANSEPDRLPGWPGVQVYELVKTGENPLGAAGVVEQVTLSGLGAKVLSAALEDQLQQRPDCLTYPQRIAHTALQVITEVGIDDPVVMALPKTGACDLVAPLREFACADKGSENYLARQMLETLAEGPMRNEYDRRGVVAPGMPPISMMDERAIGYTM